MKWLPIESAPKSLEEVMAVYGPGRIHMTVLIGRANGPTDGFRYTPGYVAECSLLDGRWVSPTDPQLREIAGDGGYTELVGATHWMPLPEPPEAP
jgi:hypothetical protein